MTSQHYVFKSKRNMKRKNPVIGYLFVISIALYQTVGYAQTKDEFYQTRKFDSLRILFFKDVLEIPPNESLERAQYILLQSKDVKQRMNAKQCLGVAFTLKKEPDSARLYFYEAIKIARNIPEKKHFISAVINYSNLDSSHKENEDLLKLLYEALNYAKKDRHKTLLYQFLGQVYYESRDFDKAEEFYLKGLSFVGDNTIGIYRGLEGLYFNKKEYDKALQYILKSIDENASKSDVNLAFAYLKAGRNYLFLGDLKNAEKYFELSDEMRRKVQSEVILGEYYYYMAILSKRRNDPNEFTYLDLAEKEFVESQEHHLLKDVYLKKSNYYARQNIASSEERYLNKYISLHDSLFAFEKNELKASLETKFLVKENQIKLENKEIIINKEKKEKTQYIFISIILILLVFGLIYFYTKKIKLQTILGKEKLSKLKKSQELEVLKAKNKERNKLSKKLHDEVANDIFEAKIILEESSKKGFSKSYFFSILNRIYLNVRDFSHDVKSIDLSEKEFSKWVGEIIENILGNDMETNIVIHNMDRINLLDENLLYELLLIIKECTINTKKHSTASMFKLHMAVHQNSLFLNMKDNGKGGESNHKIGKGLKNIEDRLKNMGGTLKIDAEDGFMVYIEMTIENKN